MPNVLFPLRSLIDPDGVFKEVADSEPGALRVFFGSAIWLVALPPAFLYFGTGWYGWRLGTVEPLLLPTGARLSVSGAYFAALMLGFVTAALVSRWTAVTYDARRDLGAHLALMCIIAAPPSLSSAVQLYPDAFIGVLVLVPSLMWSMHLLYRGLPVALRTTTEQGVLMASVVVGYLLVAAVTLLGLTVFLWVLGVGPALGV